MTTTPTEIHSIIAKILPGGTQITPPTITLLYYLRDQAATRVETNLPTPDALTICNSALKGQPLDDLLRQEIRKTLISKGSTIDLSKIPYVKIPTDTLKLIAKHQSGICLEYIVQSPIHANTLLANSWECKGHKLTKAQKQQIAQELKEATQHQNPYIILVYYLNKFINKYS